MLNISITGVPPQGFLSSYLIFFSMQFQAIFVHSMVDDRHSKFRVMYRIMGLDNSDYLFAQVISFTLILFLSNIILFVSFGVFNWINHFPVFDEYTVCIFVMSIPFSVHSAIFACCMSYLFTNPKISRDVSFIINFLVCFIAVYAVYGNKYTFLRFLNPYYGLLNVFFKGGFSMVELPSGTYYELFFILFQILLYSLLLWYIDNIYPSEDDHQKNPLFFLNWFRRQNSVEIDVNRVLEREFEYTDDEIRQEDALCVKNIKKCFGSYTVLKNINLKFCKGNIHSLLGHNGAGKSTFINILTGVYKPTEGSISYGKYNFRDLRKYSNNTLNIGMCPSFDILFNNLTVYNHLKIIGLIKNISNLENRITELMELLSITEYKNFAVSKLSGGNKRKLTLGISIIAKPDLLFLDEPTSAIDPISRKDIWDILLNLKRNRNMITLLTTHHLEEAEFLSDSINVLSFGEIIVTGKVDDIKNKFGVGYTLSITSKNKGYNEPLFLNLKQSLNEEFGITTLEYNESKMDISVSIEQIKQINKIMRHVKKNIPDHFDISVDSNTLEKAYFEIDKLNQVESEESKEEQVDFILSRLYTKKKLGFIRKVGLIMNNKLQFTVTNILEVIKLLLTYIFIAVAFSFIMSELRKKNGIKISYIEFAFLFIVLFEISMHSFSAYNLVYDRVNDIKTMIYVNKVTPLQYYLGKFSADMVLQFITYSFLFIAFLKSLNEELTISNFAFMFYLLFFKLVMWRVSFVAFSYILARIFNNLKNVLKYFSLVYGLFLLVIAGISSFTGITFLKYLNETNTFFDIYADTSFRYTWTALIFLVQTIVYFSIILIRESYLLRYNYFKPKTQETNFPITQGLTMDDVQGVGSSVQREENETRKSKNYKLKILNLRKKYGNGKVALNNVSFNIPKCVNFGLIGQNGAGKSTIFNTILSRVQKTKGEVAIDNVNLEGNKLIHLFKPNFFDKNRLGSCFQGNALWEDMTVTNNLKFYAELNQINKNALGELVQFFEFDFYLKKKVSELSSGNQRKLCILISLLINPNMLFYDEATCGVDLMIRLKLKYIFDFIRSKNQTAGIFTTHFLKDIEIFCNKLGIIKEGQFLYIDTIENIKKELGGYVINLTKNEHTNIEEIKRSLNQFGNATKGYVDEIKGSESVMLYDVSDIYGLMDKLCELINDGFVKDFTINQLSIEDIYLKLL